jgi:hypothetical protein
MESELLDMRDSNKIARQNKILVLPAKSRLGRLQKPTKSNGDGQVSRDSEGRGSIQESLILVRGKDNDQIIK